MKLYSSSVGGFRVFTFDKVDKALGDID